MMGPPLPDTAAIAAALEPEPTDFPQRSDHVIKRVITWSRSTTAPARECGTVGART